MNSSTTLSSTCTSWHTSSTTPRVQTHTKNDAIRLNGFPMCQSSTIQHKVMICT